ncbi:hypothetical protein J6590_014426 [Homalodisca vitripennis]|nr:hypothetical protein J6590_014426 [Homalodisca vitripennis]
MPEVALQDLSKGETITDVFNVFQTLVNSFQDFWEAYDSLKSCTWLIDPEHPSLKDTHCRIIIGENVSMLVTLNPQDVNTCPDIKFLGPENSTIPYINSMEKRLKAVGWNEDVSVVDNLLSLLGLQQFPQPDFENKVVVEQGECSICFTLRLDDQTLPSKVCNNVKCNSYFHITCLAQGDGKLSQRNYYLSAHVICYSNTSHRIPSAKRRRIGTVFKIAALTLSVHVSWRHNTTGCYGMDCMKTVNSGNL